MAIAAWKQFEKTAGFRRVKLFLKRATGKELWLSPELKTELVNYGGWDLSPNNLNSGSVVYSLGIADEIDFDLAMVEHFSTSVYGFDPTPASADWIAKQTLPDTFKFYPWAVAGSDGTYKLYPRELKDGETAHLYHTTVPEAGVVGEGIDVPAYTIATIMHKLRHERVDVLKIDIEGAEYDVLDGLIASEARPNQILVEFHHRFPGIGKAQTRNRIEALQDLGYQIIAVSHTGREISFLHMT